MKIASLVLRVRKEDLDSLRQGAETISGLEWQFSDATRGLAIVTLEDGTDFTVADGLVAVSKLPEVHSLTLAYEYTDEGLGTQEA